MEYCHITYDMARRKESLTLLCTFDHFYIIIFIFPLSGQKGAGKSIKQVFLGCQNFKFSNDP